MFYYYYYYYYYFFFFFFSFKSGVICVRFLGLISFVVFLLFREVYVAGSSTDEEAGIKSQNKVLIFYICHENDRLHFAIGNFCILSFFYPNARMCFLEPLISFQGLCSLRARSTGTRVLNIDMA